jgi:presenilin 1
MLHFTKFCGKKKSDTLFFFFSCTFGNASLLELLNIFLALSNLIDFHVHIQLVGSVVLFFTPAPLLLKQCYLVVTGVVVAFVFTWIPEWTTWVLLVAMAIYDILAVLVPGGPLKVLVEMAQERDEDIPALVYEARSVVSFFFFF